MYLINWQLSVCVFCIMVSQYSVSMADLRCVTTTHIHFIVTNMFSTVSCWWRRPTTQWWNVGVWLRARCMVRTLILFWQSCTLFVWNDKYVAWTAFCLVVAASSVISGPHFFSYSEGKCSTWQGKSRPLCLGPAAAPWKDTCTYLGVLMTVDTPTRWGWYLRILVI